MAMKRKIVEIDEAKCTSCGLCTSIAPDVFAMNADGKAEAVSDTTDANGESVKQAIEGCPVAAIRETE
jgi:ferredoxin